MTTIEELKEYLNKWDDDIVVRGQVFLELHSDVHREYVWPFGDVVIDDLIETITDHIAAFDAEKRR